MIIDSNVRHRRRWWRREHRCTGCGQAWPCYVAMARRAARRRIWA